MSTQPGRVPFGVLTLDYPMSIGVFATYSEAQRAVDSLSDSGFPVQNCLIVGTDLRLLAACHACLAITIGILS